MNIDFTILEVEWNTKRDCVRWISLLSIRSWNLFYLELAPKHDGGGISLLKVFNINLV